nr:MAG TPA: hypothetical protein [Caudoviricetes sp.]
MNNSSIKLYKLLRRALRYVTITMRPPVCISF